MSAPVHVSLMSRHGMLTSAGVGATRIHRGQYGRLPRHALVGVRRHDFHFAVLVRVQGVRCSLPSEHSTQALAPQGDDFMCTRGVPAMLLALYRTMWERIGFSVTGMRG